MSQLTPPHGPRWRFEALDLRAGTAIALWREQRSALTGLPPQHRSALFFSPPHFQPEPIVNSVLAMSACRGMFLPGLYLDDGEMEAAFATPDQVGEFLRRAYVGGAGGDGGDGDGGGPGPVAPPEGDGDGDGRQEWPQFHDSPVLLDLMSRCHEFSGTASLLQEGEAAPFSWNPQFAVADPDIGAASYAKDVDAAVLATSALALLLEMMRRMPNDVAGSAWCAWYADLRGLTNLMAGMGVAHAMRTSPSRYLAPIIRQSRMFERNRSPDDDDYLEAWMFLFGPYLDHAGDLQSLRFLLREYRFYRRISADFPVWQGALRVDDPLAALARIPLPPVLFDMVAQDIGENASVFHLLNIMVAEPSLAGRGAAGQLALGIALWAATCIAATPVQSALIGRVADQQHENHSMRRAFEQGHAWLAEHLPRYVFAARYEAVISASKALRYTPQ